MENNNTSVKELCPLLSNGHIPYRARLRRSLLMDGLYQGSFQWSVLAPPGCYLTFPFATLLSTVVPLPVYIPTWKTPFSPPLQGTPFSSPLHHCAYAGLQLQ